MDLTRVTGLISHLDEREESIVLKHLDQYGGILSMDRDDIINLLKFMPDISPPKKKNSVVEYIPNKKDSPN